MIKHLLIGGGGLAGFEILGILHGMQWRGLTKDVTHVASISIGTYFGAFIMMGTDSMVVRNRISSCFTPELLHITPVDICRLPYTYHLIHKEYFLEPIKLTMKEKWPDVENLDKMSLAEFCTRCGKSWSIIMTDLANACPVVAPQQSDLPVLDFIRASMALPFVLKPVLIGGSYYVDGGLTCDNPSYAFSTLDIEPEQDTVMQIVISDGRERSPHSSKTTTTNSMKTIGHYLQQLMLCGLWHKTAYNIRKMFKNTIVIHDTVMPLLPLRITKQGLWVDITPEKIERAQIHGLELFEKWWSTKTSSSSRTP